MEAIIGYGSWTYDFFIFKTRASHFENSKCLQIGTLQLPFFPGGPEKRSPGPQATAQPDPGRELGAG